MTINGTHIYTFGMFLVDTPSGMYDHPSRKKTLSIDGTDEKDIFFTEKEVDIKLGGEYDSYESLIAGIEALKTALRGGEKTFAFTNYPTIKGHVLRGVYFDPDGLVVEVKFKIQITG